MARRAGMSVRLKLTLSYAGFLTLAGVLLLAAVWVFLLRGVPNLVFVPDASDFRRAFGPHVFGTTAFGPRSFVLVAFAILVFLFLFGLAGGWLLAGRMLAPLVRITDAARVAGNGSLSHRVELDGRHDEFRELADAFDGMLARLEAHVAEQQRFAANASHELRTPLAITQTLLEVARNDPNRDNEVLDERLRIVNTRAIDLTEALLLLSRADQRSFARESVDVSLAVEQAAETLLPLAEAHGITIESSGDVATTIGSPPLLLQLTMNLLQNAIVHNLGDHGTVWVSTCQRTSLSVLTVENTGGPLDLEVVETLTEPFLRGNGRARTDNEGLGLGLAIVKSITAAHDGTLTLTPRSGGGLRVTVELPAAV